MSKKCELTGKIPMKGHNVSHANNKTKRRFLPNLKKVKFTSELLKRSLKLTVSNAGVRSVDKKGSFSFVNRPDYCFYNRQELPQVFGPNGAIYVFNGHRFLKNNAFPTKKVGVVTMSIDESRDIDSIEDFEAIKNAVVRFG